MRSRRTGPSLMRTSNFLESRSRRCRGGPPPRLPRNTAILSRKRTNRGPFTNRHGPLHNLPELPARHAGRQWCGGPRGADTGKASSFGVARDIRNAQGQGRDWPSTAIIRGVNTDGATDQSEIPYSVMVGVRSAGSVQLPQEFGRFAHEGAQCRSCRGDHPPDNCSGHKGFAGRFSGTL